MPKIFVVGLGPGNAMEMTPRAKKALEGSDVIVGYTAYIELIRKYFPDKQFMQSGMKKEIERCKMALDKSAEGFKVSVVSSGDSGIYGMAGILIEVANRQYPGINVEVIPGITAASAAAAILGAPLTHDFAVISLSDLMTPWEIIEKRIELAASADFVICIYNPRSKKRIRHIDKARDIILKYRKPDTPVGIVRNGGRHDESAVVTSLDMMLENKIDMFTVLIAGNSSTYIENDRIITPRGYRINED